MCKIKKYLKHTTIWLLITMFLLSSFQPFIQKTHAFSVEDWDTWRLKIDADMLESYKIHAAEVNVNNLQSTKVTNVTESIFEYNETGFAGNTFESANNDFKRRTTENWKLFNTAFREATGYTGRLNGDFYFLTPSYDVDNHDFTNEKNQVSKKIYDWKNWGNDDEIGQKLISIVENYINNDVDGYTSIKSSIETHINDPIKDTSILTDNYLDTYFATSYNYEYPTSNGSTELSSKIDYLETNWDSLWNGYTVPIDADNDGTINKNIMIILGTQATIDNYPDYTSSNFVATPQANNPNVYDCSGDVSYERDDLDVATFALVEEECGFTYEDALNTTETSVFEQVIKNVLYSNSEFESDIYAAIRLELVKVIAEKIYSDFIIAFWIGADNYTGIVGTSETIKNTLDMLYSKQASVQYKNFLYGGGPSNGVWYYQRSAYYFPFTSDMDMIMGFNVADVGEYILWEEDQIDDFMNNNFMLPLYCELLFYRNGSNLEYIPWLNSSIIVKNDLHHYEYWAENLSNKYDKDYFGEPKQITLTDDKDPNLTKEELTLQSSEHWGTTLFTRYKYVDYTYYIYYAMNDATKQSKLFIVDADENTSNRNGWSNNVNNMPIGTQGSSQIGTNLNIGAIGRQGCVSGTEGQPYIWIHASTRPNAGSVLDNGYWLTDEEIRNQVTVVTDHLAAAKPITAGGGNVGVIWGGEDRYLDTWWSWTDSKANLRVVDGIGGYGDYYRYDEPVRAEVTYYKVLIPDTADKTPYELCLGEDAPCKNNNGCLTGKILCECNEEMGGDNACDELEDEDFDISSTLVE